MTAKYPPVSGRFDAWQFVSGLIKSAKKSIVIIDNYVDETVLGLLTKRNQKVTATIFTSVINQQLKLDLEKHNSQYPPVEIYVFTKTHDRFLIFDESLVYHFGASLKDLGKKWFAFSRMNLDAREIINKLELE